MSKSVALKEKTVVDMVQNNINSLVDAGNLQLPVGYAASTALREAYLILREAVDKDKNPVLSSCSRESIASALLATVVSGFYPSRKHCYYIAYKGQLTCQPSYFGNQMLTRRLNPSLAEINAELIYQGDELEIEIRQGKKIIVSHKQPFHPEAAFELLDGAYAMAIDVQGKVIDTIVMGKPDIIKAWKQSRQYPILKDGSLKEGSVHQKFPGEMMKRTVVNRLCKKLINTSADNSYLAEAIRDQNNIAIEAEFSEEVENNANQTAIDFEEPEAPAAAPQPEALPAQEEKSPFEPDF